MSDEFETISAKSTRDVEALRTRYRRHRDALMSLVADAPTELIAADYRRVIADIDISLAKLDTLDGGPRLETEPGMRPLVTARPVEDDVTVNEYVTSGSDARSRLVLIAVAAVVALAAIAWLIWRASDGPDRPAVVEETTTTATAGTVSEEAPSAAATPVRPERILAVTPDSTDYGIIRKGTRATRQYEVTNASDEPVSIQVSRSTCRCLYYEHAPVVPPKGKETLTVTIDGAKAQAGPLLESLRVTSKGDPSIVTTFDVTATVR
jgi:Protein of unknown function (DUF1573)